MMQNLHCIDVEDKKYRDAKFAVDVKYCETSNDVVSRHVNCHDRDVYSAAHESI